MALLQLLLLLEGLDVTPGFVHNPNPKHSLIVDTEVLLKSREKTKALITRLSKGS